MGALYAGRRDRSGNRRQKLLYVSPFIKMAMRYHFRVLRPGERVKLRIPETDREGPLLAATFSGRRLTTAALLRSFFALPLVTLKIVAAIHWEALRLWLKGARLAPRPNAAAAKPAFSTGLATGKRDAYTGAALSARGGDRSWFDRLRGALAPHHLTDLARAGFDLGDIRQCGQGASGSASCRSAGAWVRLKAAARHA
jgi:hypothetical protein